MPSLGGSIAARHAQALGGIRPDPAGAGFKRILIKPSIVGDLHWVESHDSVHGRIVNVDRRRVELCKQRSPAAVQRIALDLESRLRQSVLEKGRALNNDE